MASSEVCGPSGVCFKHQSKGAAQQGIPKLEKNQGEGNSSHRTQGFRLPELLFNFHETPVAFLGSRFDRESFGLRTRDACRVHLRSASTAAPPMCGLGAQGRTSFGVTVQFLKPSLRAENKEY